MADVYSGVNITASLFGTKSNWHLVAKSMPFVCRRSLEAYSSARREKELASSRKVKLEAWKQSAYYENVSEHCIPRALLYECLLGEIRASSSASAACATQRGQSIGLCEHGAEQLLVSVSGREMNHLTLSTVSSCVNSKLGGFVTDAFDEAVLGLNVMQPSGLSPSSHILARYLATVV